MLGGGPLSWLDDALFRSEIVPESLWSDTRLRMVCLAQRMRLGPDAGQLPKALHVQNLLSQTSLGSVWSHVRSRVANCALKATTLFGGLHLAIWR